MWICQTVGTVVSTIKDEHLRSRKLLLVHRTNTEGAAIGEAFVAVDDVGAGEGELVLVALGSAARQPQALGTSPSDATIVGIVDSTSVAGKPAFSKSAVPSPRKRT